MIKSLTPQGSLRVFQTETRAEESCCSLPMGVSRGVMMQRVEAPRSPPSACLLLLPCHVAARWDRLSLRTCAQWALVLFHLTPRHQQLCVFDEIHSRASGVAVGSLAEKNLDFRSSSAAPKITLGIRTPHPPPHPANGVFQEAASKQRVHQGGDSESPLRPPHSRGPRSQTGSPWEC